MARAGRRRRVLNEEVRAAANIAGQSPLANHEPCTDAPRYGEQANIENHPQVTDFVPRRYRTILLVVFVGTICAAVAELLVQYADQLAEVLPAVSQAQITDMLAGRFATWCSAVLLLLIAAYARVIFMLRRHRVDDYRGRYRIWRIATWTAVGLSMNAVVGLHEPLARIVASWTGWNLLANQSGWWLLGAMLFGGWIMIRLVIDVASCRSALVVMVLAMGCYLAAGVDSAGWWSQQWLGAWSGLMVRSLPFSGNLLLLAALMFYARYVVLDVQGLVQVTKRSSSQQHPAVAAKPSQADNPVGRVAESSAKKRASQSAHQTEPTVAQPKPKVSTHWVDGTESESDTVSERPRRMSKAEKKRLRKLKTRQAA
jgi:hypothetical protein